MKLELVDINKSFLGKKILKNVSFEVESGRAMGFLGRNGAGKTTTIRTLMDVFKPDSGYFLLDGKELDRKDIKLGYLPEERGMYYKVAVLEQLIYFGKLKGMDKGTAKKEAMEWLERMGLEGYFNKNLETLSKGNQQKIQIIQSVMNHPDILVFDEPFSGLDPVNSKVLKDIIKEFIEKEKIVIFSSHQMNYVEEFCDDVCFIKSGEIILNENLEDLKSRLGKNKIRIMIQENSDALENILKDFDGFVGLTKDDKSHILQVGNEINSRNLIQYILRSNLNIEGFTPYRPGLEEIFIMLDGLDKEVKNETV